MMTDVRIMCSFMRIAPRAQKEHKGLSQYSMGSRRRMDSPNLQTLHLRVSRC